MVQFAGQMLPQGNPAAVGSLWVLANGANFSRFTGGRGGGYFMRIGWRSGMVGIGRFRIPTSPGWVVLLDDNPAGTTLPPDTPTAINPPTAPAGTVGIAAIGAAQAAGPVPVNGTVNPNQPVQCAQVIAGVPGSFTPVTVTGTTWTGNVTCSVGSRQIRVRLTNLNSVFADSNTFTVS
jgi:hypothetical protein